MPITLIYKGRYDETRDLRARRELMDCCVVSVHAP